ncbi:MAG: ribonuclease III [Patescibacteria group bacterium]
MVRDFSNLEKKLGIKFKNQNLLKQAHTHRSYLNENPKLGLEHNERLEFLGDAVLELAVTEHLYQNYKNPEGELTNWRAALVNATMLSHKAQNLGLNNYLFLSKGEAKDTGKAREIILANTFEALIGAIYLDQDYPTVKKFIEKILLPELPYIIKHKLYLDPKSKLQEITQDVYNITPTYQVLTEWGPDHAKKFKIGVYLNDFILANGIGASKQEAQVHAAQQALKTETWKKYKK